MKTEAFGIPVAVVSAEDSDVKYAVIPWKTLFQKPMRYGCLKMIELKIADLQAKDSQSLVLVILDTV